ncbi:hypothetical protein M5D96_008402 [Drosophila gunungcola]|uniref:Uncharacterized protein n=1 Tax=Drosophila gunungcola TaxID=103775 RepID=A0A9P9YK97_9MUSC|nr:hypothetical protein M5D96_008402 [Drosophila gunungcola]
MAFEQHSPICQPTELCFPHRFLFWFYDSAPNCGNKFKCQPRETRRLNARLNVQLRLTGRPRLLEEKPGQDSG